MSKKLRAICLIDIDVDSFREAGSEEAKIEKLLNDYMSSNESVKEVTFDVRERRGTKVPDLSNMKLKNA
jgi:phage gp29-like protein